MEAPPPPPVGAHGYGLNVQNDRLFRFNSEQDKLRVTCVSLGLFTLTTFQAFCWLNFRVITIYKILCFRHEAHSETECLF